MRMPFYASVFMTVSICSAGFSPPTFSQEERNLQLEEVVVTARRRAERLQDVPVSMTVFSPEQLANANIISGSDLATYTPSLQVNNRFGDDSTNFAIRGFSQELRTTASVGVYFSDVIAPRGANVTQSGDGAGPGDFFDLENVQVLKGPQGTLFGRNTTGGAVLLTPKKPTNELEGYAEISVGNFDMRRAQGVINIPVSDTFRVRLGVDHQKRDGYMNNISGIGPKDFSDMDYTSFRASAVWDVTDRLENYTILKYTDSSNNGNIYSIFDCNSAVNPQTGETPGFGAFCQADLDQRRAEGNNGFYDVYNFLPSTKSDLEQKQIINTITWEASDNLIIKNILSYAEFESSQDFPLFGTNWQLPVFNESFEPVGTQSLAYQMVGTGSFPTTNQKSFVAELQLQGKALEGRLDWQAGLYYERSEPKGKYGVTNPSMLSCDISTLSSPNPADWRCNNMLVALGSFAAGGSPTVPAMPSGGSALRGPGGITYDNQAVYLQGIYEFSDQWSLTVGLRYTDDKTRGWTEEDLYFFPGSIFGGYFPPTYSTVETRRPNAHSEEPTWLLGLDYKPTSDLLLYAKYTRGYRQGSVNLASIPEWYTHEPEQVDNYEIGAKSSFHGRFPGTFNVALFYNDFKDQQIQFGYFTTNGTGNTSILNAGASTIWGVEAEGSVYLTENFSLTGSYTYLDTKVDEMVIPQPPYPNSVQIFAGTTTAQGEALPYSPKNNLVLVASYRLPADERWGTMVASATYVYTDEMQAVSKATSPIWGTLSSYEIVNLNFNWQGVLESPLDLSLFATNVFDKKYLTNVAGSWNSGLEPGRVGQPRMYGMRLKYNF